MDGQRRTLTGGPGWLRTGTTRGSTDSAAATVPTVSVSVDAASLPADKYYGLVQVNAPNAANSPQVVTVFLQVLATGTDIGAVTTPAQVLFAARYLSSREDKSSSKAVFTAE